MYMSMAIPKMGLSDDLREQQHGAVAGRVRRIEQIGEPSPRLRHAFGETDQGRFGGHVSPFDRPPGSWRKSSYSGQEGTTCVEVVALDVFAEGGRGEEV